MFQGIPGIERAKNGRLWATWYGGGTGEDRYNYIMLVTSGDDGQSWSDLKLVIDPDGAGPVRAFDPCLWHDPLGRLWLLWAQRGGPGTGLWAIVTEQSGDEDATWSTPRHICDGIMMNKPTVLSSGEWLLPVAIWGRDDSCRVVCSTDQGSTWSRRGAAGIPKKEDRNCDEHMLVERKDGSLWLLVRTKYGIGEATSTDAGRTWTEAKPSEIQHATARFFVRRLDSGKLLLVKHGPIETRTGRSHLAAYLSDDDGRTWTGGLMLDERSGVSYPDGVQAPDGTIYVIYDFQRVRDKLILMATFTEADVTGGKCVSDKARLRVLVNQATGKNPGVTAPPPHELAMNQDGEPLLEGKPAVVEATDQKGEADTFWKGVKLFLDRNYRAYDVPKALDRRRFTRLGIDGVHQLVCREAGVVTVATPSTGRNRDSIAAQLLAQGFCKVKIPEFILFNPSSGANVCSVFQKRLEVGEQFEMRKWGVLIH